MKELEKLVSCMKKKCGAEETAVSILNDMASVEKRLMSSGKATKEDVALLKALAKKVSAYRVNAENTRCMVQKCMDEYTELMEKNMKKTAARMDEAADAIERLLGERPSRPSKKPSSKAPAKKSRA